MVYAACCVRVRVHGTPACLCIHAWSPSSERSRSRRVPRRSAAPVAMQRRPSATKVVSTLARLGGHRGWGEGGWGEQPNDPHAIAVALPCCCWTSSSRLPYWAAGVSQHIRRCACDVPVLLWAYQPPPPRRCPRSALGPRARAAARVRWLAARARSTQRAAAPRTWLGLGLGSGPGSGSCPGLGLGPGPARARAWARVQARARARVQARAQAHDHAHARSQDGAGARG